MNVSTELLLKQMGIAINNGDYVRCEMLWNRISMLHNLFYETKLDTYLYDELPSPQTV